MHEGAFFMLNKWYFDLVGTKQIIVVWFMFIFMINFVESITAQLRSCLVKDNDSQVVTR